MSLHLCMFPSVLDKSVLNSMAEMLDVDQDRIKITQRFECLQISPLVANKTK